MSRTFATLLINTMLGYCFTFDGCYKIIPISYHISHTLTWWRNCRQKYESMYASTCPMLFNTHLPHSNNIYTITDEIHTMTIYCFTFGGCYKRIPDSYHISYKSAWWRKCRQKYESRRASTCPVLVHTHLSHNNTIYAATDDFCRFRPYTLSDTRLKCLYNTSAHMGWFMQLSHKTAISNSMASRSGFSVVDPRLLWLQYDMPRRRRVDHKVAHRVIRGGVRCVDATS